jgi:hypothetical protein
MGINWRRGYRRFELVFAVAMGAALAVGLIIQVTSGLAAAYDFLRQNWELSLLLVVSAGIAIWIFAGFLPDKPA